MNNREKLQRLEDALSERAYLRRLERERGSDRKRLDGIRALNAEIDQLKIDLQAVLTEVDRQTLIEN